MRRGEVSARVLGRVHVYRLAAALVLAGTAGCAPTPPVVPVEVASPVPVPCPAPPARVRPRLPVSDLGPEAPDAEVMRAYAVSLERLGGYCETLETDLDGYR